MLALQAVMSLSRLWQNQGQTKELPKRKTREASKRRPGVGREEPRPSSACRAPRWGGRQARVPLRAQRIPNLLILFPFLPGTPQGTANALQVR
jgi:hypothetical protein